MLKKFWDFLKQKLKVSLSDAQSFHLHWSITTSRLRLLSLITVSLMTISFLSIIIYIKIQTEEKNTATLQQREIISTQAKMIASIQNQLEEQKLAYQSIQDLIKNTDKKEPIQKVSPKINAHLIEELSNQPGKNEVAIQSKIQKRVALKKQFLQHFKFPILNKTPQLRANCYSFYLNNQSNAILSCQSGKVVHIDFKKGSILLAHPYGIYSFYSGLNSISIKTGQTIQQQEEIGKATSQLDFFCMKQDQLISLKSIKKLK